MYFRNPNNIHEISLENVKVYSLNVKNAVLDCTGYGNKQDSSFFRYYLICLTKHVICEKQMSTKELCEI